MKSRTSGLIVLLALGLLAGPPAADAEQAGKLRRIGYLSAYPRREMEPYTGAFRQTLRELGWIEGQKIIIEERHAEGKLEDLSALAADLVRLKMDVIVSSGTPTSVAAKQATTTIPIVMLGGDPVGSRLVASLARPGGNVTGIGTLAPELSQKQLELLKEVVPRAARVAVLWNPGNPQRGELTMAKILKCGDLMPGCSAVIKGKDVAEVMAKAAEHAKKAHGMATVPSDVAAKVQAAIKDT